MGHRALTVLVLNQFTSEIALSLSFIRFRVFKRLVDISESKNTTNGTLWHMLSLSVCTQQNGDPELDRLLTACPYLSSLKKLADNLLSWSSKIEA